MAEKRVLHPRRIGRVHAVECKDTGNIQWVYSCDPEKIKRMLARNSIVPINGLSSRVGHSAGLDTLLLASVFPEILPMRVQSNRVDGHDTPSQGSIEIAQEGVRVRFDYHFSDSNKTTFGYDIFPGGVRSEDHVGKGLTYGRISARVLSHDELFSPAREFGDALVRIIFNEVLPNIRKNILAGKPMYFNPFTTDLRELHMQLIDPRPAHLPEAIAVYKAVYKGLLNAQDDLSAYYAAAHVLEHAQKIKSALTAGSDVLKTRSADFTYKNRWLNPTTRNNLELALANIETNLTEPAHMAMSNALSAATNKLGHARPLAQAYFSQPVYCAEKRPTEKGVA